ncbi:hypothetical protein GGI02_003224 [Coemansia sp. RSA 2322]|uniref:Uncharacterized protein n=1 Tax=Coemansia thaxteri TaxID=2663907 RepID=A0A9W8B9S2_9FUNG|nr:hypothetical protein H4R26_005135 [Coemansia thaxteri]KAJ2470009.1 hypothetical protein GGI02_003224 [Coemansia sp. RSA 2322]KAJ2483347.1 hypothetical protein EV174_002960 [Coemansia sp. RSA 2320]
MFKATFSLVYVLALVAIQAYPIAEDYQAEEYEAYAKRDGCGLFGCGGPGIHFTASNLFPSSQFIAPGFQHTTTFPDLTFSTGGGFNIPGMMPCNAMSGQSCGGAPQAMPPQAMPPQAMPPQAMPAPPPLAPQGCDQSQGQSCGGGAPQAMPPQQETPQVIPPQQETLQAMPPQQETPQAMPAPSSQAPQGCDQSQGQSYGSAPQAMPPQQMPAAPGAAPCDQAQGQACGSNVSGAPTSFNLSSSQSKSINASDYKDTTLYFNQKQAKSASSSANSNTNLNYSH